MVLLCGRQENLSCCGPSVEVAAALAVDDSRTLVFPVRLY